MNITEILMSQLGDDGLNKIGNQIGADKSEAKTALEGIVPTMLGAMSRNTRSTDGANGLLNALEKDHDGSILNNLSDFLQDSQKQEQGNGILRHVLGNERSTVEHSLASKTSLSSDKISELMKIAAPIIMGIIGKQKRQSSTNFDQGGIASILSNFAGTADKNTGLDLGDLMDMVGAFSGNNSKSPGGVGGLLKGLFGN